MKKKISNTNIYLLILIIVQVAIFALFLWDAMCYKSVRLTTNNEILNAKIELLEKHETWTIGVMGISIVIATILMGLLQFYFTKKAEDNVFRGLAKIANEDKEAFKEAVRMKSVELELMSDYPISIIFDPIKSKEMANDIFRLLNAYHFNDVNKPISYEAAFLKSYSQKSILVFCEDSYSSDGCQKLLDQNPDSGVLGFGQRNKAFTLPKHNCLNYANSLSSVYNNLMSLLHYKRYLNKSR